MPAPSSPATPDPRPDAFDLHEQHRLASRARARRGLLEPWAVAAAVDQAATAGTFPPRSGTGSGDLVG